MTIGNKWRCDDNIRDKLFRYCKYNSYFHHVDRELYKWATHWKGVTDSNFTTTMNSVVPVLQKWAYT